MPCEGWLVYFQLGSKPARTTSFNRHSAMKMRITVALIAALTAAGTFAKEFPIVNAYGFDWLKPNTTKCRPVTKEQATKFKRCEFSNPGNAFGLDTPLHKCTASAKSEYFIYESKAMCQEAFETMQANAP